MGPESTHDLPASIRALVEYREAHNASVDEDNLRLGACAQVHLPTGRMCTLRHGHPGSCEFVTWDQVQSSLDAHRGAEGW